jgi:hypothetical protein
VHADDLAALLRAEADEVAPLRWERDDSKRR